MAMLFMAPKVRSDSWVKHLRAQDCGLDLRVWPETGPADEIEFILCWKHPLGELKKYPNLKCIASLGFGVDHILRDPDLPPGVSIARLVDEFMVHAMSEYILTAVLCHTRQFDRFQQDQFQKKWQTRRPLRPQNVRVGIMGLGHLGADAARLLRLLGFQVSGWSRTPKHVEGITAWAGPDAMEEFLAQANVLVCLLPLTRATQGILNSRTFTRLPEGAYLINAARGEHLVEADLLAALDSGHLSGACLDVFREEPLPESHPFWSHPRITVTPHSASLTDPRTVAPQIVENYRRVRSGLAPRHVIDIEKGY
ncbi:MAG: glyoxylate/hydroxypyruvate reductase A [Deltaproteobacteria bacterium]|nr:glyoxylate/hydroxypyruvate reductase A [Deltaproteobacteria bacterium]